MIDEKQRLTPEKVKALKEEHNFKLERGGSIYLGREDDETPLGCYVGLLMHTKYNYKPGSHPVSIISSRVEDGSEVITTIQDRKGRYLGETGEYALYLSCLELGFEGAEYEMDPCLVERQLEIFDSEAADVAKLGYEDGRAGRALADVDYNERYASYSLPTLAPAGILLEFEIPASEETASV